MTAMVLLGLLRVSPSAGEVRTVRRWLYGLLADGHAAVADDAVVGACELVTNSIKHSDTAALGGEISIAALSVDDTRLRIEVIDAGSSDSRPMLRKAAGDALSGRGLQIVAQISAGRWGARADDVGQLVWFEVPAPSPTTCGRYDAQTEVRLLASPDASYRRAGKAAPQPSPHRLPCLNTGDPTTAPVLPIPPGENGGAGVLHTAMSTPAVPSVVPYEIPPEARATAAAELRTRFPGVTAWYGNETHSWWALLPELGRRGCLVEANTPAELAAAIALVRGQL